MYEKLKKEKEDTLKKQQDEQMDRFRSDHKSGDRAAASSSSVRGMDSFSTAFIL
jgi:hypothetical protein